MAIPGLRSGKELVRGVAFFGRTLDKIRLQKTGRLPDGYNVGTGFDAQLCQFLGVDHDALRDRVLAGDTDEQALGWCYSQTREPTAQQILLWNSFVLKRGWRDESTSRLEEVKAARGFAGRADIQTWVDFHDADEGRM